MTTQKSFKSQVRARMGKTGESYTTARRQVLARSDRQQSPLGARSAEAERKAAASEAASDSAANIVGSAAPSVEDKATARATAGHEASANIADSPTPSVEGVRALRLPEASLMEQTGRGWDEWFALLDEWGATARKHGEIARWLMEEHRLPGWWAQGIAVTYGQARGMRVPGQNSKGGFYATSSRTIAVPVSDLFTAFNDEGMRRKWLPDVTLRVRTATEPRSFRADWGDDGTRIVVGFEAKGEAKAQVAVSHEKLADSEDVARRKAFWREQLADLKKLLEG